MDWLKRNMARIAFAVLLVGLGILLYPSVADWWNSFHQSRAVLSYTEVVANMDAEEYDRLWAQAEEYNARLAQTGAKWTLTDEELAEYASQLRVGDSGVIGEIVIRKINVDLPLYLGTSNAVLQVAVGHLEGTSLPVGGASTHSVLSGHRGLPSAKLFTDLDRIVEGDTFQVMVLDRTLTYQVDQIRIVEPTDLSDLAIVEGEDLCTLVTCTPYGINTHRLLVRGHRVANPNGEAKVVSDAIQIEPVMVAPVIAVPILVLLLLGFLVLTRRRRVSVEEARDYLGVGPVRAHEAGKDPDGRYTR